MVREGASGANRPVVYSTDVGRVCPTCQRPATGCTCRHQHPAVRGDGIVRVSRDRRNRHGKTVTVVRGVSGDEPALTELAGTLKRLCGSGGTVKDGVIEIQGDHSDLVAARLTALGYRVKLAGG